MTAPPSLSIHPSLPPSIPHKSHHLRKHHLQHGLVLLAIFSSMSPSLHLSLSSPTAAGSSSSSSSSSRCRLSSVSPSSLYYLHTKTFTFVRHLRAPTWWREAQRWRSSAADAPSRRRRTSQHAEVSCVASDGLGFRVCIDCQQLLCRTSSPRQSSQMDLRKSSRQCTCEARARKSAHPSQPARMLPWTQCRLTSSLRLVDASFLYQEPGDGERRAEWIATSCATNQSLLRPFEAQRKVRSAVAHLHGSFHHSQRRQIFCRHDTQMLFTPVSNSAKGLQPALLTSSI